MFVPATTAKLWLCNQPVDMRCSFNGLSALVKHRLQMNPLGGDYFIFVNRRKTMMKVLYFAPGGYCVWSQRLEQGQFPAKASGAGCQALTSTQWQWLLVGIEVKKYRQFKRLSMP
jgi:transposase